MGVLFGKSRKQNLHRPLLVARRALVYCWLRSFRRYFRLHMDFLRLYMKKSGRSTDNVSVYEPTDVNIKLARIWRSIFFPNEWMVNPIRA